MKEIWYNNYVTLPSARGLSNLLFLQLNSINVFIFHHLCIEHIALQDEKRSITGQCVVYHNTMQNELGSSRGEVLKFCHAYCLLSSAVTSKVHELGELAKQC